MTKLQELHQRGQSVWLDMIRRGMLASGELEDLVDDPDRAGLDLAALDGLGIDLDELCEELQRDGVRKFVEPFEALLGAIRTKRREVA